MMDRWVLPKINLIAMKMKTPKKKTLMTVQVSMKWKRCVHILSTSQRISCCCSPIFSGCDDEVIVFHRDHQINLRVSKGREGLRHSPTCWMHSQNCQRQKDWCSACQCSNRIAWWQSRKRAALSENKNKDTFGLTDNMFDSTKVRWTVDQCNRRGWLYWTRHTCYLSDYTWATKRQSGYCQELSSVIFDKFTIKGSGWQNQWNREQ